MKMNLSNLDFKTAFTIKGIMLQLLKEAGMTDIVIFEEGTKSDTLTSYIYIDPTKASTLQFLLTFCDVSESRERDTIATDYYRAGKLIGHRILFEFLSAWRERFFNGPLTPKYYEMMLMELVQLMELVHHPNEFRDK